MQKSPATALPKLQAKNTANFAPFPSGEADEVGSGKRTPKLAGDVSNFGRQDKSNSKDIKALQAMHSPGNVASNPQLSQKVKAGLFGFGGNKDVSSDIINVESTHEGVSQVVIKQNTKVETTV